MNYPVSSTNALPRNNKMEMKEEFVKNKQTKLEINQCQCMALFQSYFENIYIFFLNLRQLGKFETRQIIFLY